MDSCVKMDGTDESLHFTFDYSFLCTPVDKVENMPSCANKSTSDIEGNFNLCYIVKRVENKNSKFESNVHMLYTVQKDNMYIYIYICIYIFI